MIAAVDFVIGYIQWDFSVVSVWPPSDLDGSLLYLEGVLVSLVLDST